MASGNPHKPHTRRTIFPLLVTIPEASTEGTHLQWIQNTIKALEKSPPKGKFHLKTLNTEQPPAGWVPIKWMCDLRHCTYAPETPFGDTIACDITNGRTRCVQHAFHVEDDNIDGVVEELFRYEKPFNQLVQNGSLRDLKQNYASTIREAVRNVNVLHGKNRNFYLIDNPHNPGN